MADPKTSCVPSRERGVCSGRTAENWDRHGNSDTMRGKRQVTEKPASSGRQPTRREIFLLTGGSVVAISALASGVATSTVTRAKAQTAGTKPNILVIFGDDIGYWNISAYNRGMMGYRTPNIDRIAKEGAIFTDPTPSSPARPGAPRSSPARAASAPACSRSACRAPRKGCPRRTRRSPTCSSRRATPPASSARTTSATATSSCRPSTASTSSSATSTTSTPRRSRRTRTIRRTPSSARSSARAAC